VILRVRVLLKCLPRIVWKVVWLDLWAPCMPVVCSLTEGEAGWAADACRFCAGRQANYRQRESEED